MSLHLRFLRNRNNKFVFEITESLLIKRDKHLLNKNFSSAKLFIFDNSWLFSGLFIL